jgi:predicted DNA-binding transcriptional regulator AlpA
MRKRLRYADIERLGIVRNRVTLTNWIRRGSFPTGQLTGPNTRTWDEQEVQLWLDSRPTAPREPPPRRASSHRGEA